MSVHFRILPEQPQAALSQEPFHRWHLQDNTDWTLFFRVPAGYRLRFPALADFEISADGTSVQAWPAIGVSEGTIEHLYLNQILPLALSRQGRIELHASAIDLEGVAVAFMGESGRGKSTLAASFATSGVRFLTDDGLHLTWRGEECWVTPSHPSVRLWEDSQSALIPAAVDLAPALEFTTKSRLLAGTDIVFCDQNRPLKRVYCLGTGESSTVVIEPLKPAEALMELVRNSFLLDIEERDLLAWHFDEMSRLAALPMFFRLDYPRRYEDLPEVRDAIARHIHGT